jgi:hypothetical protein
MTPVRKFCELQPHEDWLHELSIDMFPENGRLYVYGVGEDGVPALTEYGIESQTRERPEGRRRRSNRRNRVAAVLTGC